MRCPFCGYEESKVIDSRATDEGTVIRRRRECMKCEKRFTSYEKIETIPIVIIKKDGRRELFDKHKILNGILKACEKRPVSLIQMENAANEIENLICNSFEKEITSDVVGEMVMERLSTLDEIAYVRFASVYKQFKDVNTFMEELNKILCKNK